MHRPLRVVEIQKGGDRYDEDKLVKKYMSKYGVNNVRGGSYCKVNLPGIKSYTVVGVKVIK